MSKVEEIEAAVKGLKDEDLARFRRWFAEFDAELWDRKIESDARAGRLDRFAEEAAGRMSLEIHLHPPAKDVEDESAYRVTDEVLEQARQLGLEGDVEAQIKRMARDGTPYTHSRANLRHGPYALRIEANGVVWLGLTDAPGGRRKPK